MKYPFCLVLCLLLAACAAKPLPRDATQTFGLAAERIGRMGEEEFLATRADILEMNTMLLTLSPDVSSRDITIDESVPARDTADRITACRALRYYGELLMRLASDDRTQFMHKAAYAFADTMAATLSDRLHPDQQQALAGIVAGLSGTWSETRRLQAIRDIVLAFEPTVAGLSDLLVADLVPADATRSWLMAYDQTAARLQGTAATVLDAGEEYSLDDRARAAEAWFLGQRSRSRALELSRRIGENVAALKYANAELADRLRQGSMEQADFTNFARQIHQTTSMQQVFSR